MVEFESIPSCAYCEYNGAWPCPSHASAYDMHCAELQADMDADLAAHDALPASTPEINRSKEPEMEYTTASLMSAIVRAWSSASADTTLDRFYILAASGVDAETGEVVHPEIEAAASREAARYGHDFPDTAIMSFIGPEWLAV